jgi:predicted metal-dependent enzyme (double-stranded beta helix superfamily)
MTKTTLDPATNELPKLADLPTEMALRRAARFLVRLVEDAAFLEKVILPVRRDAQGAKEWYVARRYTAEDGSYSLQVFAWPPGTGTKIHDHSSWGAYRCFAGSVVEERYERLDDGSRVGHARLKQIWQLWWSPEAEDSVPRPRAHHANE